MLCAKRVLFLPKLILAVKSKEEMRNNFLKSQALGNFFVCRVQRAWNLINLFILR